MKIRKKRGHDGIENKLGREEGFTFVFGHETIDPLNLKNTSCDVFLPL
jgi:hypothetical protein